MIYFFSGLLSPYKSVLPANLEVDFQIFRKVLDVPVIKITRQLMSLVTFPLILLCIPWYMISS